MCRIEKLIRLKYLILETSYTFFSMFSWYFKVFHILDFRSPMVSGINSNNFSFFGFSNLSFFVFVFYKFLRVPSQNTLISQEVFCDYQINLGNTTNLNSINISGEGGRTLYKWTWHNHLETMLYYLTLISF